MESKPPHLPPDNKPPVLADDAGDRLEDSPAEAVSEPVGAMGQVPDTAERRLHPFTLLIAAWNLIRQFIIPGVILFLIGGGPGILIFLGVMMGLAMAQALVRYFTFSYRIENGELVTRRGLLERNERNIPLDRVQDIRLEQGMLHRMLGVVDVHVETAGGVGAEASLSVLRREEGEMLRTAVFSVARKEAGAEEESDERTLRALSLGDLVKAGLTSNQAASFMAIVAVVVSQLEHFVPRETFERFVERLGGQVEQWVSSGAGADWIMLAAGGLLVLLAGVLISIIGSIVLFHGFRLALSGEDLHRSYGLFTRRSSSLPRRRIQVLKIEETLLRRMFRLVTLRADTAGNQPAENRGDNGGRNVLVPVLGRNEVEGILPAFFPDLKASEPEWRRVSTRAIRRGSFKGTVALVFLSLGLCLAKGFPGGLWPLLLLPLVYGINVLNYRHLGYTLGAKYFRTRRGWLGRSTHIVPIRNIQAVLLQQSPFDRLHGVMTLQVDTAGQAYTGGSPRIDNVPEAEARQLAAVLGRRASETRYRW